MLEQARTCIAVILGTPAASSIQEFSFHWLPLPTTTNAPSTSQDHLEHVSLTAPQERRFYKLSDVLPTRPQGAEQQQSERALQQQRVQGGFS